MKVELPSPPVPGCAFAHSVDPAGRVVVALCDGRACWGPGARAAISSAPAMARAALAELERGARDAVTAAFAAARRTQARIDTQETATHPNEFPGSTCVGLAMLSPRAGGGADATVAWAGHVTALLVRDGVVLEQSARHLMIDEHPPGALPASMANVTARAVTANDAPFDVVTWCLRDGDALLLIPRTIAERRIGQQPDREQLVAKIVVGHEAVAIAIDGELDLHTFHPRELRTLVPDYLEECRKRGILAVRLVHGRGTGAVRDSVHALLRRSSIVVSFRLAGADRGGAGATLVDLES